MACLILGKLDLRLPLEMTRNHVTYILTAHSGADILIYYFLWAIFLKSVHVEEKI